MTRDPGQTFGFLRAVHRRHVLLRAVEHGAIGVIGGGLLGLMLLLAMLLTSGPVMPSWMIGMAGCAGGIFGALAGWIRRPTMLESAMQADRQLDGTDLFSTAWQLRRKEDPWARQVIVCADVRCSQLSPSAVLLARWGSRGWGGVGLVCVLMFCASLLIQQTQVTRAANRIEMSRADVSIASSVSEATKSGDFTAPPLSPPRAGSADAADSPIGSSEVEMEQKANGNQAAERASGLSGSEASSDAAGAGMARTSFNHPASLPEPSISRGDAAARKVGENPETGGGGAPSKGPISTATVSPGAQAAANSGDQNSPIAPSNPTGPVPRSAAFDQQTQPQYQPYSQLIREYFQRD